MDEWLVIWLAAAVFFAVGEMTSPGSFFLLPFAVGAAAASLGSLIGVGLLLEWVVFLVISCGALLALRPLARRLDRDGEDHGIGARRLIGQSAVITQTVPEGDLGIARVQREDWRAESLDGSAIPEGTRVRISDLQGTRVVVSVVDADVGDLTDVADSDDLGTPTDSDPAADDASPPTSF